MDELIGMAAWLYLPCILCCEISRLVLIALQVLSNVSYLKTITDCYIPGSFLPSTAHVFCHNASHKSMSDFLSGWAAGTIRPVAAYMQPVQLTHWTDTFPSSRDIDSNIDKAIDSGRVSAAATQMYFRSPLVSSDAVASTATVDSQHSVVPLDPPVHVVPLNQFCWDSQTQTGATDIPASRGMIAAENFADGVHDKSSMQLMTSLPMWLVHDETGSFGEGSRQFASLLGLPVYGLEAGPAAFHPTHLQAIAARYAVMLR